MNVTKLVRKFRKTRGQSRSRQKYSCDSRLSMEALENRQMFTGIGFGHEELWIDKFGADAGNWDVDKHPRMMADVNGDGKDDVVGFGKGGVFTSLSTGSGFANPSFSGQFFGYDNAWRTEKHPRFMADVNGDGKDDIVGFGDAGTYVALSNGHGFGIATRSADFFGYDNNWRVERHPRMMADVNGDGRADVVGFGNAGVYVGLSNGSGFHNPTLSAEFFGYNNAWRTDKHPRMMGDVNGDGRDDVVGFGDAGTYVSLSTGNGFADPTRSADFFGYNNAWRTDKHPRMLADVNGDGRDDVVGFGNAGVYVGLSTGTGFANPTLWVNRYGVNAGGWEVDKHPRMMADVNADGKADVVGFGNSRTYVSISTGNSFNKPDPTADFYRYENGWRTDRHPRMMADVNGDGRDDIVGFGNAGAWVSVSTAAAGFANSHLSGEFFGYNNAWRVEEHPRMTADVNGDGRDDVVGFGNAGVYVSLSNSNGFDDAALWINRFGRDSGWEVDKHPRMMADVNGDGREDVVGFGEAGVFVALSTGSGFTNPTLSAEFFGYDNNWRVDRHPRMMADVNGDGRADVVGFGNAGTYVSLSTGNSFASPTRSADFFGYHNNWRVDRHPRMMADVNGDGRADVVGFGNAGTYVSLSTGNGFASPTRSAEFFGYHNNWRVDRHPRMMADVNGDGRADVVGFGNAGTYVSLSTGSGFANPTRSADFFGFNNGWRVDQHPRLTADVNGDCRADIIGFGNLGTYVSLSTGSGFGAPRLASHSYGQQYDGWIVDRHPRMMADVNGDGRSDIVGFGNSGIHTELATISRPIAGDANQDGRFDSSDLIQVFQAGAYQKNTPAGWAEGDWNCDHRFDTSDLVAAFQQGHYQTAARPKSASVESSRTLAVDSVLDRFDEWSIRDFADDGDWRDHN